MTTCHFIPENIIFDSKVSTKNKIFKWNITRTNVDKFGNFIPQTDDSGKNSDFDVITSYVRSEYFNITFSLQNFEYIFIKSFRYIEIIAETNFNPDLIEIISVMIDADYLTPNIENIQRILEFETSQELPTKYYVDTTNNTLFVKASFHVSKSVYSTKIRFMMRVKGVNGNEGYQFFLKTARFSLQEEFQTQPICSPNALSCHKTDCYISKEQFVDGVSPWENRDCVGSCGVCETGFICNKHGKCEEE